METSKPECYRCFKKNRPLQLCDCTDTEITEPPKVFNRIMKYAGKSRNQVSNPNLTARECIHLANYIKSLLEEGSK